MKYNLFTSSAPAMPKLGRGTECIKILVSQASKDMCEPLVPMLFPVLGAHVSGAEFQYPDLTWKEPCGQMANLVAESGGNKGQLGNLAEAICRTFRQHDKKEMQRLVDWQRAIKTRAANREKPERPEVCLRFPPADVTNPAFIQNAMALEAQGGHTQYLNMPEVEMADRMCGGHRQVTQMLRNIYDRERAGALRATADGVTGNPLLRVNLTLSSTPGATRKFYKYDLFNGTAGRMTFSYKPRGERNGRIPRQGSYDEAFYRKLDEYLMRLADCKGRHVIHPLNRLVDKLSEDMAVLGDQSDENVLWDFSKRSLVSAWKAGCILWILHNQTWSRAMGELVEWLVYHDLWSKIQLFGDMLHKAESATAEAQRRGPQNMLDSLPGTFNEEQLAALRSNLGKSREGTRNLLSTWKRRKFIAYNPATGLYAKTEEYLKGTKP